MRDGFDITLKGDIAEANDDGRDCFTAAEVRFMVAIRRSISPAYGRCP